MPLGVKREPLYVWIGGPKTGTTDATIYAEFQGIKANYEGLKDDLGVNTTYGEDPGAITVLRSGGVQANGGIPLVLVFKRAASAGAISKQGTAKLFCSPNTIGTALRTLDTKQYKSQPIIEAHLPRRKRVTIG